MNKRRSILDTVRNSNNQTDKNSEQYKQLLIVKEVLLRYFEIYDMDNGTIHFKVFSMLYQAQKYHTYSTICKTLHIGKNTLIRYIAKYDELALKVMARIKT